MSKTPSWLPSGSEIIGGHGGRVRGTLSVIDISSPPMKRIALMKSFLVRLAVGTGLLVLCTHTARAQWVQTNGPAQNTVLSLAVSDTVLIAGTYSGVYCHRAL
jgi:hypothetical protein